MEMSTRETQSKDGFININCTCILHLKDYCIIPIDDIVTVKCVNPFGLEKEEPKS